MIGLQDEPSLSTSRITPQDTAVKPYALARRGFATVVAPVLRLLASPWFDPQYLRGRHFDTSLRGWRWVWWSLWTQKLLGFNRHVPWPVSPFGTYSNPARIRFDPDDMHNFQAKGAYLQTLDAEIVLGSGFFMAQNVGMITTNHDPSDPSRHLPGKSIVLGRCCWLGMNAVILPGVTLGDYTTVGANAVVTKSFPEGYCTLAGNPARVVSRRPRPGENRDAPEHG